MKRCILLFILTYLHIYANSSWDITQEILIKIPNEKQPLSLDHTKELAEIQAIKALLQKQQFSKVKEQCQLFLKQYPISEYRIDVVQLLKKIANKNLQIYNLFGASQQQNLCEFMVNGHHVSKIQFTLWQVDLLAMLKSGIPIDNPIIQKDYCKQLRTWDVAITESYFSQKITVNDLDYGFYILLAEEEDISTTTFFFVSQLSLVLQRGSNLLVAWGINKIKKPCDIYVIKDNKIIYQGKSNSQGIWSAQLPNADTYTIVAHYEKSWAVANTSWYTYQNSLKKCYLYTDRSAYLPQQTIFIKGVLRDFTTTPATWPQEDLRVIVQDQNWRKILDCKVKVSEWGTFDVSHEIAENTALGEYFIRVSGHGYYATQSIWLVKVGKNEISTQQKVFADKFFAPIKIHHLDTYISKEHNTVSIDSSLNTQLFVTWGNDKILGYRFVEKKQSSIAFTLTPEFFPYVEVNVCYVYDGKLHKISKKFKVDDLSQKLMIHIDEANRIRVLDQLNQSVEAEFSIAAIPIDIWENFHPDPTIYDFFADRVSAHIETSFSTKFEFKYDRELPYLVENSPEIQRSAIETVQRQVTIENIDVKQFWQSGIVSGTGHLLPKIAEDGLMWIVIAVDKQSRVGTLHQKIKPVK